MSRSDRAIARFIHSADKGDVMEMELLEPVVESKEEIVELSLEELSSVGGGTGCIGIL